MIVILQALNWLNVNGRSGIPDSVWLWIDQIEAPHLADTQKLDIYNNLLNSINRLRLQNLNDGDRNDTINFLIASFGNMRNASALWAEILIICSAYAFGLNRFEEAASWLQDVKSYYNETRDTHRLAVTCWMRYIVLRALGQYQSAFNEARQARALFTNLAEQYKARTLFEVERWYNDQVGAMTCDLLSSPEDTYEWLCEFEPTKLNISAGQIKNELAEHLEKKLLKQVQHDLRLLLGVTLKSIEPIETGEALTYCGVIAWVLESRTEAVQFFRSALTKLIPGSHKHALVRWMLGLALFANPAEHFDAINNMEICIKDFDCLRQAATYKNRVNERDWYVSQQLAMKKVLQNRIDEAFKNSIQ